MSRRRRDGLSHGAGGLPPSATEKMAWRCGRRLGRVFEGLVLVTLPLPAEVVAAMTPAERRAMRDRPTDWWPAFWDGWDSVSVTPGA